MIAPLLNHLWQSSLCVGAAGLMALALRRNGAHVRFWLWFTASVKFLVPFAALTALGATLPAPAVAPMVAPMASPAVALVAPLAKPFSEPALLRETVQVTAGLSAPSPPPAAELAAKPAPPMALPSRSFHMTLQAALLSLWAAGFLLFVIRWLVRWQSVRALLRQAVEWRLDAPVAVKFSPSRLEPGLVGILDPVILLPSGIEQQLSPEELKAVLAHELSHWRRHDNLLAAIHMLVEALFWFFPLVWWLGARLNAERERACDEAVLADGNDPDLYAGGILKVCRAYLQSPLACVAGVSGASLKDRIDAIMKNRLVLKLNIARKLVLSISAVLALAVPLALGLVAAPVAPMGAKAAQIFSPVSEKLARRLLPAAPESITSPAAIETMAPLVLQAAAPVDKTTVPDPSGGSALTRQDTVQAETPVAPLPNASPPSPAAPEQLAANDPPAAQTPSPSNAATAIAQPDASRATAMRTAGLQTIADTTTSPTTANNGTCDAPRLMNSLAMEQVPGSELRTITATIDGKPVKLLIDIGRLPTQLWDTTASNLRLTVQSGPGGWDFAGRYSEDVARIGNFEMGSIKAGGIYLQVTPAPNATPAPFDGVLRNDAMRQYDIDLDFAHQRLNYFTTEKCKGAGIYWSPTTISVVPILAYTGTQYGDRSPIPRLNTTYVPVTLDGHVILALLDTSLDRTFLNPDVAQKLFGLNPDALDAGDLNDGGALIKAGLHRFSTLTLGGLTASNPLIGVPFDIKSQSSKITHAAKTARSSFLLHEIMPDIVVGMDMLKHTHLYVSFQNDRLYVSAAGDGQALNPGPIEPSRLKEF